MLLLTVLVQVHLTRHLPPSLEAASSSSTPSAPLFSPVFEVLPIGATCTVTVDVVATGVGMLDNVTNDLLADFTSSGKASDTLEVTATQIAIRKSFTDDPVPPGGTVTLEFIIDNFDRNFSATAIAFTDGPDDPCSRSGRSDLR